MDLQEIDFHKQPEHKPAKGKPLADRMDALATLPGTIPFAREQLHLHAARLRAIDMARDTPSVVLRAWARARVFWCELTGEPLL